MNYYYEVKLNFNDVAYNFYEWSNNDKLDSIKKIPLIKVKSNIFKNIVTNNFKVNDEFFCSIEGRTLCEKGTNVIDACIFCDTKNCIAIEFDKNRNTIARSTLMLEDENNICDISYSLKYRDINVEKISSLKLSSEFRQEVKIKKIINKEIFELYKKNDIKKLEYLYYEWFGVLEDNKDKMLKRMYDDLKFELKHIHYEIYNIIKLSYSKI